MHPLNSVSTSANPFLSPSEDAGDWSQTLQQITTIALMALTFLYLARHVCRRPVAAAPLVPRPLSPDIKNPASRDIPFNTPLILTTEQVIPLQIVASGLPENPAFKDSYFQANRVAGGYEIVRKRWKYPNRTLFLSPQGIEFQFPSWPRFEEFLQTKDVPVYVLENLPEKDFINSGATGQVYDLSEAIGKNSVLKLDKSFSNTGASDRFILDKPSYQKGYPGIKYLSSLPQKTMLASFDVALAQTRALRRLPDHQTILQCQAIMWVTDLNQWGVVYEKIENARSFSYHVSDIRQSDEPLSNILHLMHTLAAGLQILDEHECTQTDLKETNILIRKNGLPVIIDLSKRSAQAENSIKSRQQFGTLLYRSLVGDSSTFQGAPDGDHIWRYNISKESILQASGAPEEAVDLIIACWSTQSMEACSWADIQEVLKSAF